MASYIPDTAGLLPKWLLLVATISLANSVQAYLSPNTTRRVYSVSPLKDVTALGSRTFGTWTAVSSIIRFYAAYHIGEKSWYDAAMWTFGLAWLHFISEWLIFKTVQLGKGSIGPFCVATGSLIWMFTQRDGYI